MKRVENYRKGDRAEKLAVVLLQSFCAVAEVPRQEDFGLMDAVATLLRRDGACLYAEDSFLVQTKSRTERRIEYAGRSFETLLNQDLPLLLARVDLTQSSVELHTLGIGLAHPNINDAKSLVIYLRPPKSCPCGLVDEVLHLPLRKPILRWTTGDTEDRGFTGQAYAVLKAWLNIERWNRRYRKAGVARVIRWETNAVPTAEGQVEIWNPACGQGALAELIPAVRLLASRALEHPQLRAPMRGILSWMRERDADADPSRAIEVMLDNSDAQDWLSQALSSSPGADVAITYRVTEVRADFLAFWLIGRDREGRGSGRYYAGSLHAIREQGFKASVEVAAAGPAVTFGLSDGWLVEHGLSEATATPIAAPSEEHGRSRVILLRRKAAAAEEGGQN